MKIIKNSENAKHHRFLTIEMIDGRIEVERKKKRFDIVISNSKISI